MPSSKYWVISESRKKEEFIKEKTTPALKVLAAYLYKTYTWGSFLKYWRAIYLGYGLEGESDLQK